MASQDVLTVLTTLKKQITASEERLEAITANSDIFFLIVNAMIIYFMQCGFAFLECGAVRAKNATNILLKNILDSFIGAVAYWLFGYAFAFGKGNFFIGWTTWANNDLEATSFAFWFFHFVFAATAATIVSGALAERCDFAAYLIYSVVITGFVYPVVTHWAWSSDGWLAQGLTFNIDNGTDTVVYQDFAGSGVVHLLGGMAALIGAAILGKRVDRVDDDGNIKQIPGHSVPLAALGGFILFFGFFAFNGGSQASISQPGDGEAIALSVVNTIISGAFAAISAMVVSRIINRCRGTAVTWSLLVTVNGGLAGMVAICASCNTVYNYGAAVIGVIAGINYLMWSFLVTKIGVDDPLDAVAVHAGSGIWGVLAAPILSREVGILYTWSKKSFMSLAWNLVGVVAITGWAVGVSLILFGLLRTFKIFRVNPVHERKGLDIPKHGEPAYPTRSYGDGWTIRPMEADTYSVTQKDEPLDSTLPYTITSLSDCQLDNGDVTATKM